eukprot:snap_masked-scaffold_9-processed-gene-8.26-mRNA-1 protein AED:1.00 eAED:1.00 QI:0/0/0/0/1/1/2/0/65
MYNNSDRRVGSFTRQAWIFHEYIFVENIFENIEHKENKFTGIIYNFCKLCSAMSIKVSMKIFSRI